MKFGVIFFLIAITSLSFGYEIPEAVRKSLLALHDKCMAETNASVPHLQKCKQGYIPEDHDAKCYLHCMISQSTVDLEQRFQWIAGVKHEISQDIHNWKSHVNQECDLKISECNFNVYFLK